ncbi:PAS domain-containing sensor histidine kinase [Pseudoneobacillus rhizosphaerae]|uniref:histidine kinase n=1 Tax=Pseudoneobacillus rhizosphaerae TaxID=2880968 RepID=A0A9C7G726_9BACI|nr:PAS domain S-box protein [Pseudoneobacillus rhizosphaerae]CAG9607159.1 Adaptive-response sensory-kinase SasA [Pseudoneobacillus rhizosphaerae]
MANEFPIFKYETSEELINPDGLLDLFLNCSADGFAIVDMKNRFIRVNPMYTQIFGFTEEDVLGKNIREFPNPDSVYGIIDSVQRGQVFSNLNTQRTHKNGTVLDIAVSYSPLRNIEGEIIAVIAIFRDITEKVNLERELKKIRELYNLITENTTDMIKVFKKDFTIIYASPSYEKLTGRSTKEIVGQKITDFVFPDEVEPLTEMFQKLLATGEPQLVQKRMMTATNEVIYAEYNISPIYNDQKEIESFVIVGRNVTDRLKNDAALRNLDRLSIIGQLAAGVAHEIRNPLTSLKGFSKLLKRSNNREAEENYLSIIMEELDRIDMIVNEFMSLAKPQAIQFERENLISILDSTVKILHPQALMYNVQIQYEYLDGDIPILCNPNQLKQVFVNFIKNAIESMPKGGLVHIAVVKLKKNRVLITFADKGVGIGEEMMHYLGTPFYTTKDKGIGLGLTVSNKIILEHNGTMKIDSQIGKGTTVSVELECM